MTRATEIVGSSRWMAALPMAFLMATMAHPAPVGAQTPAPATLTVNVSGIRNAEGKVLVALYREPAGFPDTPKNALRKELVDIDAKALTAKAVFADVPPGSYAVAVLHDENGNGDMDKNFLGIPKEGHGASKNPSPMMRAPTFDEAKFTMSAPATLEIKLQY
jgi:uncharacterized protein (DUF2141 family)